MDNKILKNHTLEEYNKKYSKKANLLKFSKKEVEKFGNNNALLGKKNWWLIEDTYYEVPAPGIVGWWKGLKPVFKGLTVGGVVAVIAAAVTVPLLLLNHPTNPVTPEGSLTQNEWRAALGTNIQIGNGVNVKCTIKEKDSNIDSVFDIIDNKAKYKGTNGTRYDIIDEFGFFTHYAAMSSGPWFKLDKKENLYSMRDGELKYINDAMNAFKKYKYDSITKMYTYIGGSGSGGEDIIGSIKFNSKKQIESAITINNKRTYSFEYGTATIDESTFPKFNSNYNDLINTTDTSASSASVKVSYDPVNYRINMEKFKNYDDPKSLSCTFGEKIDKLIRISSCNVDGTTSNLTIDDTGAITFDKTNVTKHSKIIISIAFYSGNQNLALTASVTGSSI